MTQVRRAAPRRSPLSPAQHQWLVECLLRGIPPRGLRAELQQAGVLAAAVDHALDQLAQDPVYLAATRHAEYARKLAWRMDIRRRLDGLDNARATSIPRHKTLTRRQLVCQYVSINRPVVLTGIVPRWPAYRKWSCDYFRKVLGNVRVQVADHRTSTPYYDLAIRRLSRTISMRAFVDWVEAAGSSNERYMVANNNNLGRGALEPLHKDITPYPAFMDPRRLDGFVYLWFGPAGTMTHWHHDTTNILFSQVVGRKRIELIHPLHHQLLHHTNAYYATVDPRVMYPDIPVQSVVLQPGETLLIPVAWWHRVEALDISMSVSMTNFRFDNDYEAGNPYANG